MSEDYFQQLLSERQEQGLYRNRMVLGSSQDASVIVNGKPCLAFCSNDYLGLANHPDVVQAFQKAADEYGVGSGASNLILGHSRPQHQLEEELADFLGRPRVLLFSTGYMANLGVMSALLQQGDAIFQDRLNHASLLDAGRLSGARFQRFRHLELDDLEQRLISSSASRKLIATDGVFSMDGDQQNLPRLAQIASKHQAMLMLDDAHGFGVLGKQGKGTANADDLGMRELPILMATLGKSLGTFGAFVAGSEALIEVLIQFSRSYIYTTAMPPAVAEATRVSLGIMAREQWRRDHLFKLVEQFRAGCMAMGIPLMDSGTPIQPIMIGSIEKTMEVSRYLESRGIIVTAIRPPTVPRDSSRLRVTFSASHSHEQVNQLLDVLSEVPWDQFEDAA
ncbi:8-amino-7-oxononanoate synthase [Endozoicomonas arenosclerae]|uniref:8-amino-7-oxononanoate synthase n=1 Tax=Endozoicomonas arenosclerae TaxID=1633495 RepID=UPI0007839C42|nr:8-amino-7-oxononanoate synthase [Endozoicomonas arenosclerae]